MKRYLSIGLMTTLVLVGGFFVSAPIAFALAPNWDTTGNYVANFNYLGSDYPHDISLTQDGGGNLTGNGGSPAGSNVYTWVIDSGTVSADTIDFHAHYTATADAVTPLTEMDVTGIIAPDGSMTGTWSDNYNGGSRDGTWTTTSGNAVAIPPLGPVCIDTNTNHTCDVGETSFATIQEAVTAASAGDTIQVMAGTYAEHVVINKALTINGANVDIAGNGTRGSESIVDGSDSDAAFAITANDVTINGFTVQNGSGGSYHSGIWSQTGNLNLNILNNIVTQNGFGVWAQCGGNCMIQNNLFDGNNKPGPGSAGISADSTTGLTIDNNEFINHTDINPILIQAVAPGAHTNIVVSNNSFHNNTGASVIYALAITGGTFSGNSIVSPTDLTGISFSGANVNVNVTDNTFDGMNRGVRVEDAGYYGVLGDNSNITLSDNSFLSNSEYGVGNDGSGYVGLLDATDNWWGDASGPNDPTAADGSTPETNAGTGSPAVGAVNYSPWFTNSGMTTRNTDPIVVPPAEDDEDNNNGGGSSSGSRPRSSSNGGGQVLGASTDQTDNGCRSGSGDLFSTDTGRPCVYINDNFKFLFDLRYGMNNTDVVQLQARLRAEGFFTYPTNTGYFGPITFAAVKAYQAAHPEIGYVTGFCGPLTRGVLNQ